MLTRTFVRPVALTGALLLSAAAFAAKPCVGLPSHTLLQKALSEARGQANGGLNLDMWATIVDRSGIVCNVAFSGKRWDSQWLGSRVISAQKANTANAFSLRESAFATANLFSGVQPGGFLFGLQESNPVDVKVAYRGQADQFGTDRDPMVGDRIGGVNVFGGGLALYDQRGEIVGGIGVSGDTSCADHNIAWRARNLLNLDYVPGGVAPSKNDQIIYDLHNGKSASGFGHPTCIGTEDKVAASLPATRSVKK